jgi:DNA-binding transcriptional regulator LsrR (DeoR family)
LRKLSDKKEDILFRRAKITELHSIGYTTDKSIAEQLGVSRQTVNSDLRVLRRQANIKIEDFQAKLPYEYDTMIAGVKQLLRRNWEILNNPDSTEKAVSSASHIILDCYEKLNEQLQNKFYAMDGLNQTQRLEPKLSTEEIAQRQAYEEHRRRGQAIF